MKKLCLRHIEENDFAQIKKFIQDERVSKYLTWSKYEEEEEIKKYFLYILNAISFPDETLGIIYNNELIGTIHIISRGNNNLQFGFGILPEYWKKGIGKESVKIAISYLKRTLSGEYNLWGDVNNKNISGIKVLLINGFILKKKEIEKNRDRYILRI